MHRVLTMVILLALGLMTSPVLASHASSLHERPGKEGPLPDQAGCGWQPGYEVDDLDRESMAFVVFDDGTGEALFVGGAFSIAGGVVANFIAKWDGSQWSALSGPSGTGLGGAPNPYPSTVYALAVFDDGTGEALYAGGDFTTAGGITVNYVAKWDGTNWSALSGPSGIGTNDRVSALTVYDDGTGEALYAGGAFSTAGGVTVNYVAKWDGNGWSALSGASSTGVDSWVLALAMFDDGSGEALYAGGVFTTAGGVTVNCIAKWNGTAWSALGGPSGTGMGGAYPRVNVLAVLDDGGGEALFAGGIFGTAGGVTVNYIAKWSGTGWSALTGPSDTGVSYTVLDLTVFDDGSGMALFAGGVFDDAGGVPVNHIAKWDGTEWSALSGSSGTGVSSPTYNLGVYDDGTGEALFAGGNFITAGGVPVNSIAKWDGSEWSALSEPSGVTRQVHALTAFDDGDGSMLYAAGNFFTAGGVSVNRIAKWDGSAWSALSGPSGVGMNNIVYSLAVFDDGSGKVLYAGGPFTTAGGVTVNHIAKWDGTEWSVLSGPSGIGMDSSVVAMAVFDDGTGDALYAGGQFPTAGGVNVNYIAKWDGTTWTALSGPSDSGMDKRVLALTVFDDGTGEALYAGGRFSTAGGVTANRVAKWDGTEWSDLGGPGGGGMNSDVLALAVYDDGIGDALYAGGWFTTAGGVAVNYVAKWDGTAWQALSGPSGVGMNKSVFALTEYDAGDGGMLYAGGWFTTAGGLTANYTAAWDGTEWTVLSGPLDVGMDDKVRVLAVHDDGTGAALYAGGDFTTAGGLPSNYLAKWLCNSLIFSDGFETGDSSSWSASQP